MFEKRRHLLYFSMFFILYELTVYLSNDMIMPAMLQVVRDFNASNSNIVFSLSLYVLGGSMLQIFLGPIADRVGKRKVMLFGNALFLLATLVIPFVHSIEQFLTARFFQGMGSCFIFIGYAMIHELFDDSAAVKLTTILSNTTVFAPLIGPVVGSGIISVLPWQYVFGVSLGLGSIAWIGLYKFMPAGAIAAGQFNFKTVRKSYLAIFSNKKFMFGIFVAGISITPLTAWIGLSPVIVLEHMKASYTTYIVYQCVIFSGFIVSSIGIQRLGDKLSLTRLIRQGAALALLGFMLAGLAWQHGHLFIIGMFIFSAGFGLFNGALIRIALTATGESMSLTSSAMSLLYCIYISGGLVVYNLVGEQFDYSLGSYALFNVPLGLVIFVCLMRFVQQHQPRPEALPQAAV
ncbi:major Facilitator Superfamily protein [Janthinobacterium agaricidamnosum NBRC 102515 = DSM 9628]|uniref:Multidrug transporter MdfA n=2 Tax=Janthinobacterium agaricidamnosum TaxID=55508 RepID=W0V084_9BURK|nr:major Facilitator Superfamily protein [Janthinobacterium agaricidamnosum NBRC 102515 = DSM 9628]